MVLKSNIQLCFNIQLAKYAQGLKFFGGVNTPKYSGIISLKVNNFFFKLLFKIQKHIYNKKTKKIGMTIQ